MLYVVILYVAIKLLTYYEIHNNKNTFCREMG